MVRGKNLVLIGAVFAILLSLSAVTALTFRGFVYDVNGNSLNNTNVSVLIRNMNTWAEVSNPSAASNASGAFNFTIDEDSSYGYQISVIHTNASTNSVDYVGKSLPLLPYQQFTALDNISFYLQEAATINITVRNNTEVQTIGFGAQIKDTGMGYPVSCTGFVPSTGKNYICYVPKNRNYSVMVYPSQGSTERFTPVSFFINSENLSASANYNFTDRNGANLSWFNSSQVVIHKQFNVTQSLAWIYGNISRVSGSATVWNNFTVIPFLLEPGNMIFMANGILPYNASFWRGPGFSDLYFSDGRYNLTVPYAPAETNNYLFLAVAQNNSIVYGSYRNISVSGDTSVNFTMYGLLGESSTINMTNSSGGVFAVNVTKQKFNIVNSTNSIISSLAAHAEFTVDYTSFNSTLPTFTFMDDLTGQGDGVFSFPLLNISGIKEANIFSQTYAPKRVPSKTVAELSANSNITLSTFNPGAIDGSVASSGISIYLYKSNSTCDVPNPPSSCLLTDSATMASFNPIKSVFGGGKISFRMGTSSGILVHYVNVDLLASGPPDALFDNKAGTSETTGSFANAMRFGSAGPTIYDSVLVSIPYSEAAGTGLDDSKAVSMSIPYLYDDSWNIVWNVSANGTDTSALAGNNSHYSAKQSEWGNLTTAKTCATANVTLNSAINATNPCYIDNSSNRIWIRLPHFSGTGPSISGTLTAAATTTTTTSSSSSGTSDATGEVWYVSYYPKATELESAEGYNAQLIYKGRAVFKVGTENHQVGIVKIDSTLKQVTINVSSIPQTAVFNIGDEKKFDVNADGYYDVYVKLKDITTTARADIIIKTIHEQMSSALTTGAAETSVIGTGAEEKTEASSLKKTIIWIVVIVVLVAVIYILLRAKREGYFKSIEERILAGKKLR